MNGIIIFVFMNDGSFITCKKLEVNDTLNAIQIDGGQLIDPVYVEGIKFSTFKEIKDKLFNS
jgi:hypothetical protein